MFDQEIQVIKALANGVNYFTGEVCKDESILNHPKIIRTLYEVCEALSSITPEKIKKTDFVCPYDIEENFEYEDELSLTRIIERIGNLYPNMKKLKYTEVAAILIQKGILKKTSDDQGKSATVATEFAEQYGIYNATKTTQYGRDYNVIMYNKVGQRYVLAALKELNQ